MKTKYQVNLNLTRTLMTVGLIGASAVAQAAPTVSRSGLAGWYTPADAKTEWSKYCSGSYEDVTMAPSQITTTRMQYEARGREAEAIAEALLHVQRNARDLRS